VCWALGLDASVARAVVASSRLERAPVAGEARADAREGNRRATSSREIAARWAAARAVGGAFTPRTIVVEARARRGDAREWKRARERGATG